MGVLQRPFVKRFEVGGSDVSEEYCCTRVLGLLRCQVGELCIIDLLFAVGRLGQTVSSVIDRFERMCLEPH